MKHADYKFNVPPFGKLTKVEVLESFQRYHDKVGFGENTWYLGYATALRDADLITFRTWDAVTNLVNAKEHIKK